MTSAEDILSELGVHISKSSNTPSLFEPESPAEKAIYNVLTSMPQPVDELVTRAKLPASEIVSTLTLLELTGAAKNVGNGMCVRS